MSRIRVAPPVWLYLHGFASSPRSKKAVAFERWGAARGTPMRALDMRVPSFEHLRVSAMRETVVRAIDAVDPDDPGRARAVIVGSSLGGFMACHVAAADPRVVALFLMAPAFRLADVWRARLGEATLSRWRDEGSLEVDDHATGGRSRVDYGFFAELATLDRQLPDLRMPVCIVHGTRDDVVPIETSRELASGRPNVELLEVDDGHELAESLPRILALADAFFARDSLGLDLKGA